MGTLRRQPGIADLAGRGGVGLKRRESVILKEIENRRERRGLKIGSKQTNIQPNEFIEPGNANTKTSATISHRPYIPPITILQKRRRGLTVSSRTPALSPIDGRASPLVPAPELGDPHSLSVVIPSPSYSNLDYSTAGSSASTFNSLNSPESRSWGERASTIYPMSVAVAKGHSDTPKRLGGPDGCNENAREDTDARLNGESSNTGRRVPSIRRSVSLKQKDDDTTSFRPRSQSVGGSARAIGRSDEVPPLPTHMQTWSESEDSGAFVGGLSIDLGSRYVNNDFSPRDTPSTDFASPRSADTSVFPSSTPTSPSDSHSTYESAIRIMGKPRHAAFNESDLSILAPSTVGLGFSPVGTPESLPESLKAEAIDLTETGRKVSTPRGRDAVPAIVTPPTPHRVGGLPKPPSFLGVKDAMASSSQRVPPRSVLLAQNRFFLPPTHPKPATSIQKKASLKPSKSLGAGVLKSAYIANPSPEVERGTLDLPSSTTTGFGRGLLQSASIRSIKRFSHIVQSDDGPDQPPVSGPGPEPEHRPHEDETERPRPRLTTTPSMRFGTRRSMATFPLCSPPHAIEPLLPTSPDRRLSENSHNHIHNKYRSRAHSTVRSNRSSPFLSASNSLRVIFGREGFVARSLSQAFDRHHDDRSKHDEDGAFGKSRLSSPLEPAPSKREREAASVRCGAHKQSRENGRSPEKDRAWRQSVLQQAVSLSISSGLNRVASNLGPAPGPENGAVSEMGEKAKQRMVSSGSKARLAIPDILLAAPHLEEHVGGKNGVTGLEPDWTGLGEGTMMSYKGSMESEMSLRTVVQDWPGPSRALVQMGGEQSESVSSGHFNGASSSVERPLRRLQGKGFPRSFSFADLKPKSRRGASPSANRDPNPDRNANANPKSARERGISPPLPIPSHLFGSGLGQEVDSDYDSGSVEELRENSLLPSPMIDERARPWIPSARGVKDGAGLKSSSPRSGMFRMAHSKDDQDRSDPASKPGSSTFGLSLRTSLRSKTKSRPPIPTASASRDSGTHGTGAGVHRTPSSGRGISSDDLPLPQPILDELIAREESASTEQTYPSIVARLERGEAVPLEVAEAREREKVRKVLDWRDEVGENGDLARLDQKIRGFVVGERERLRDIGRRESESEDGEMY